MLTPAFVNQLPRRMRSNSVACASIGASGLPISAGPSTSRTKCVAVTASSPLHAAVALTSPNPSTPSSVTTRTSVNVEASCTTRAPRTLRAAFARAETVVVSTAAIVGPCTSGTGVGELLERRGDCGHAGGERLLASLPRRLVGPVGEAVELLPAPGLADDEPRRAARARRPPGDGLARPGRTRSGSSASMREVSKLPA